jgi:hypothetical protein
MRKPVAICTLAALLAAAHVAAADDPAPPAPAASPPAAAAPPAPPPAQPAPAASRPSSIIVLPAEPAPDGLSVGIDDVAVEGPGVPHVVSPGQHVVRVSAPGKQPWSMTVDVPADGAAHPVSVPLLGDAPMAQPAGDESAAQKPRHRGGVALMAVGFSVGGTALLLGAVMGAGAISATNKLKNECPNKVCPSDNSDYNAASALAIGADIAFPIAAIGIGLGIAGIVVHSNSGGPETDQPPPQTSIWIGPGSIGGSF